MQKNNNAPPASTQIAVPGEAYFPKKTAMTIKKTSLLIDELEIRRAEEQKFMLTTGEVKKYEYLQTIFKHERPAADIELAIENEKKLKEIRKEYLTAKKIQRENKKRQETNAQNSMNVLLLASGLPIMFMGFILLNMFFAAGVIVIVGGVSLIVPAVAREIMKSKKARKELKNANKKVKKIEKRIERQEQEIDNVCKEYGFPINCTDKTKYLKPLLNAANEYEFLIKKQTDYELLLGINNTEAISREIAGNLLLLSGKETTETDFKNELNKIENQMY